MNSYFAWAPAVSLVEEISSAPVPLRSSSARLTAAEVSQWTDIRTPPFLTRPS